MLYSDFMSPVLSMNLITYRFVLCVKHTKLSINSVTPIQYNFKYLMNLLNKKY